MTQLYVVLLILLSAFTLGVLHAQPALSSGNCGLMSPKPPIPVGFCEPVARQTSL